jgi:predicted AlkP superfamily pyrophosphatase or phosphodiesterase
LKKIDLYIFIDSYGYELLKKSGRLHEKLIFEKPVKMQFGYSSTAIPSILTGVSPSVHQQFTFFYHIKDSFSSMFTVFDSIFFKCIPSFISGRRRFRVLISKMLKKYFNINGYFDLYSVPFWKLKYFNYSEMNDLFDKNAFKNCENLKDYLSKNGIKHFISNWRQSEEKNFSELFDQLSENDNEFIFAYFAGLDGVQHMHTKDSKETNKKIEYYKEKIKKVFNILDENYSDYRVGIFSDHGMTTLTDVVDIGNIIKTSGLKEPEDFLSFLDSTMARFWYYGESSRERIRETLGDVSFGKFLSKEEMMEMGVYFKDQRYGEDIFLVNPGVQIAPSDMGKDPLPGMHGYSPEDKDSDAIWLSNYNPKNPPSEVKGIFSCMLERFR